jgi:hypothetical protein
MLWFNQLITHLMSARPHEYKIYVCLEVDPSHPFPVIVNCDADSDVLKTAVRKLTNPCHPQQTLFTQICEEKKQTLSKDTVENFELWKIRYPEASQKLPLMSLVTSKPCCN